MSTLSDASTPVLRGVMTVVPEFVLQWRKRTGAERWDEMWDGVLHMTPSPNRAHQHFQWWLETWLWQYWAPVTGGRVFHEINLSSREQDWRSDYRVPDLVLLLPDRFHIDQNEYFCGAPTAVVEIHSPGDEAFEKLGFYQLLGVEEVWIIDRDARTPTLHVLEQGRYAVRPANEKGWHSGPRTGVEVRSPFQGEFFVRCAENDRSQQEYRWPRE